MSRRAAALRGGGGVEADRRGGGQVQGFRLAVDRDPDGLVRGFDDTAAETMRLVAEQPRGGLGQQAGRVRLRQVESRGARGRERADTGAGERSEERRGIGGAQDRQMEDAADGGAHRLRAVRVDRVAGHDHRVGAGGIGEPDDGAGVARIGRFHQHREQPRPGGKRGVNIAGERRRQGAAGGDALRGHRVGELRRGPVRDFRDGDAEVERGAHDGDLPGGGVGRHEQFPHGAGGVPLGGDGLADGLGAIGQEFAGLDPSGAAQQLVRRHDPRGAIGERIRRRAAGVIPGGVHAALLLAATMPQPRQSARPMWPGAR
jgi:hypothetical protein